MYSKQKPIFPKLHKCGWCGKRLNKTMPIISKDYWTGDGWNIECYFCSEKCAKAEHKYTEKELEAVEKLNKRICL